MISPIALKRYRQRKLDDHSWLKRVPARKINLALAKLKPKIRFEDLRLHQKVYLLLGVQFLAFFILLDMGGGKSVVALRLIEYLIKVGKIKGIAVVLVPNDTAIYNWEDEIKKWCPGLPYRLLTESSSKGKWRQLGSFRRGVVLATYPGYRSMISALQKSPHAKHKHRVLSEALTKR